MGDNKTNTNKNEEEHVAIKVDDDHQDDVEVLLPVADAAHHEHTTTTQFDDSLLHQVVGAAGRWAYGTLCVEVWVLDASYTKLHRPAGGFWLCPNPHSESNQSKVISKLQKAFGDVDPGTLVIGEGIPGVLFAESVHSRKSTSSQRQPVVWRDVQGLANDPDQPYNEHLQTMASCGIGWAAACPFSLGSEKGIVVFYVPKENIDPHKLHHSTNETYIQSASDLIGTTYALREPRLQAVDARRRKMNAVLRRVREALLRKLRQGVTLEELASASSKEPSTTKPTSTTTVSSQSQQPTSSKLAGFCQKTTEEVKTRTKALVHKSCGGKVKPPPMWPWHQALYSGIQVFLNLLVLCRLSVFLVDQHGPELGIVLAPMGALNTLLYGLTAAPASQPRNAMVGQAMAVAIAIGIQQTNMDVWMKQSMAGALAIGLMAKFGIIHPPAAAAAVAFSGSESLGWGNYGFVLVATAISIVMSTITNNWNLKRQYPTFWGIGFLWDGLKQAIGRGENKNKDGKQA